MSTIVSTFIQDRASAKQLPTATVVAGSLKVWVLIQGAAVPASMFRSFGVSSLGDDGLGVYMVNFSAPLLSYSCLAVSSAGGIGYPASHGPTQAQVAAMSHAGALQDANVDAHVVGDLA